MGDALQAVIRILGTVAAAAAVIWFAMEDKLGFWQNIQSAGPQFLSFFPGGVATTAGFVFGFAGAAIGFGLGQPQIVSRYLAGRNPAETRSAMPIYISFVQGTCLIMTLFGVMLRGVEPGISDPETGLSVFFRTNLGPVLTGLIAADVFATIASTSNGLLVAMAQSVTHDLTPTIAKIKPQQIPLTMVTFAIGLLTMLASLLIHGSVYSLALSSVSLMGAGLAPAVMTKVLGWRHSSASLLSAVSFGLISALVWKQAGLGSLFNEAAIGMRVGLTVNYLVIEYQSRFLRLQTFQKTVR